MAKQDTLLWLADTGELAPDWFEAGAAWLAASESERLGRFRREERRRQYVAGRVLLRLALGELLGLAPRTVALLDRPGNAPALLAPALPGVGLSIAHSGRWVACAVSAIAPLGLDIERADPGRDLLALAEQAFGKEAAESLARLDAAARSTVFYRMWCRHEAHIKLGGEAAHDLFYDYPGLTLALASTHALHVAPAVVDIADFAATARRRMGITAEIPLSKGME